LQNDCKENGLEQRQIQSGGRYAKLLVLINSCAQVRSQYFSEKAICAPLTIGQSDQNHHSKRSLRAGGVQAVEHLPSKCKALSSSLKKKAIDKVLCQ
jgi:hypothetical protein